MTRNGKIARLPANIRHDLNLRLENGGEGATLLAWLNGLPEVQAGLKAYFDGAPVSKQNLSEWRQGGFREWQLRQEWIGQAGQLADGAEEMEDIVEAASLPGALAGALAARYAALLNSWDGEPDPKIEAKLRLLRGLNQDIALLQRTIQRDSQQKRELEQEEEDAYRRETEEMKQKTLDQLMAVPHHDALEAALGGGERAKKLADLITAVKYDLPLPGERQKEEVKRKKQGRVEAARPSRVKPTQTGSGPVEPSQSQSNSVKPDHTVSNPVAPSQTESNLVKPDSAASGMSDAGSEGLNKVDS